MTQATTTLTRAAVLARNLWVIAAFVALNAPYWLLGQWLFISRPLFNVELILPVMLAARSWRLALPALGALWLLDLVFSQSRSYRFTSPQAFLASTRFLSDVQLSQFFSAEYFLFGLPFVGFATLAWWLVPRARLPWAPALVVVGSLAVLDIANGSSMLWQPATRFISANVASAPLTTLLLDSWNMRPPPPLAALGPGTSATSLARVSNWTELHPDGSVLIVIVESMGWHRDAGMRDWLRAQLFDASLQGAYRLEESAIPFHGSTTSAELRELCHLYGSYQSVDAASARPCLPIALVRKGWTTVGLHGFSSHMFDRVSWWPQLGLQHQQFAEDLATAHTTRCGGAFVGLCDAELLDFAVAKARRPRTLVYALTLNSHLPLSPIEVPDELRARCHTAGADDGVCMLTATLGVALRSLKVYLGAAGAAPEVVVVGDHAPPFGVLSERNQFDQGRVPAFLLEPR